ncbi:arylesterase [Thiomicrorhabdus sp. zzn3]|uniref:arylesterase n=1 Tax=Thiomicrorhabdus sp. zzn3 TaxID=3039775 RepID=UPI0024373076|nr:arylesterase [Thiomicrorhabdus sp. zzn3]MDG6777813.1 arylesterase [Thiomicrorhabdus sp. zzn3]
MVSIRFSKMIRWWQIGLLVSLLTGLGGCSDVRLTPLAEDATILAFGDSLTAGVGVRPEFSYPSILAQLSGRTVVNAGVSGETTGQGVKRFAKLIVEHQPQLVIILEGGNDLLRNEPESKIATNLGKMIQLAQSQGIQVLLVGVPEKKLFSGAADFYEELAETYEVPLEEEIVPDLMGRLSMKSDYVHFNQNGYRALAEAIYEKLRNSGAFPDQ